MTRSLIFALSVMLLGGAFAQRDTYTSADVRVSVVLNADGSRTVYETDAANHKSVATTTAADGKLREKIRYDLDENGRFARGEVYGPKEQFRFFTQYKYDSNGRLAEETQRTKDQSVLGKIVYRYDATGHQVGYSAYDGQGRLIGQSGDATPAPGQRK